MRYQAGQQTTRAMPMPAASARVLAWPARGWLSGSLAVRGSGVLGHLRYGGLYQWYALFGVLDVLLTWALIRSGGMEANWIAAEIVAVWGFWGLLTIKVLSVATVVAIAEFVGERRPATGLALAIAAVVMNFIPAALGWLYLSMTIRYAFLPDYWVVLWGENPSIF